MVQLQHTSCVIVRRGWTQGVLVLLICVQILVCLDCFSHSIIMEVWKPARWKTAKIHRNEHTPWLLVGGAPTLTTGSPKIFKILRKIREFFDCWGTWGYSRDDPLISHDVLYVTKDVDKNTSKCLPGLTLWGGGSMIDPGFKPNQYLFAGMWNRKAWPGVTPEGNLRVLVTCLHQVRIRLSALDLKPRVDITKSPKTGYQWSYKMDLCRPKIF